MGVIPTTNPSIILCVNQGGSMMCIVNTYNHLLFRRELQGPFHEWVAEQCPHWLHITITSDGESKWLTVHSRIHVNKEVKLNPSYSTEFSDRDIIKDLSAKVWSGWIK